MILAKDICEIINVKRYTLNNWYKWYKTAKDNLPEGCPGLPEYQQDLPKLVRYWKEEDIEQIKQFQQWIPKGRAGVMGEISCAYWSGRGKKTRKKELENDNE